MIPKDFTANPAFAEFLFATPPKYRNFVMQVHDVLVKIGCKAKFGQQKSGYAAQYTYAVTNRLAWQFVASDDALVMYLYAGFIFRFDTSLDILPSSIIGEIKEFRNCTDMEADCFKNTTISGKVYRKCMNGRKRFTVDDETVGIVEFLENVLQKK